MVARKPAFPVNSISYNIEAGRQAGWLTDPSNQNSMIEHRAKETSLGHSEILAALYYKSSFSSYGQLEKARGSFNGGTASWPNLKLMLYVRNI